MCAISTSRRPSRRSPTFFVSVAASLVFTLAAATTLAGCAADSAGSESTTDDFTSKSPPLSGDELRFEKFLHVDRSTLNFASHTVASSPSNDVVTENGERIRTNATLYLERDRTFTLYYSETVMVDQANGRSKTRRKLAGAWRAKGATLELGDQSSATTAMATNSFGNPTEGLIVILPADWASTGLPDRAPFFAGTSTSAGPDSPYYSDFH